MAEHNEEVDAGRPFREFADQLKDYKWRDMVDHSSYYSIRDALKTPKGREAYDEFLQMMSKAPSLKNVSKKADGDIENLITLKAQKNGRDYEMNWAIGDLIDISVVGYMASVGSAADKARARKTLMSLVNKGYPKAQIEAANMYLNEGNTQMARAILAEGVNNPYASEVEQNIMDDMQEHRLPSREAEIKEGKVKAPRQASFMDTAETVGLAQEVSEDKIRAIDQSIVSRYAKIPYQDLTKEDVKALSTLASKGYPGAQDYLSFYYADRHEYGKAYNAATQLRDNPVANDEFRDRGEQQAQKMMSQVKMEQRARNGGR